MDIIKLLADKVRRGELTLEQLDPQWREAVETFLENETEA